MKPENDEMDRPTFEAAFALNLAPPDLDALFTRFKWARDSSGGDGEVAMAAVNEVLASPITLDEFIDMLVRAA